MEEPLLEDLFAAFRDRGDAAALAVVFDRTAGELLTLALHLAPETSAAEDLVQATFLAAIQGATSFERGRRVMPWLFGILANQAARARRDRARVVDPMRVEARVEPDPALAIEQSEILATLTAAIDELPETCREAVRRHVLDGDRAVDIARDSGAAPGTVRMQILRGLERLRRTLPTGLLSMSPTLIESSRMASIKSAVISAASSRALNVSSASSSAAGVQSGTTSLVVASGGVIVNAKLLVGVLVVLAIILASWRLTSTAANSTSQLDDARERSIASNSSGSGSAHASEVAQPSSSGTQDASRVSAITSGWRLTGEIRGLDGFDPKETVVMFQDGDPNFVHADAQGHYVIDMPSYIVSSKEDQDVAVFARHPANREANAKLHLTLPRAPDGTPLAGHEWKCDLTLKPFTTLTGKLETKSKDTLERPWVALFRPRGSIGSCARGEVDKEGNFKLRWDDKGAVIFVASAQRFAPMSQHMDLKRGGDTDMGVIRLESESPALEGRVALTFDCPTYFLRVHAERVTSAATVSTSNSERLILGPHDAEYFDRDARVDASGAFVLCGLRPGEWSISLRGDDRVQVFDRHPVTCSVPGPPCVIGAGLTRSTIQVRSEGELVPDTWFIDRTSSDHSTWRADGTGKSIVLTEPGASLDLDIQAEGFTSGHLTIQPTALPVDAQYSVDLEPDTRGPATLVLTTDDMRDVTKEISVDLVSPDDGHYGPTQTVERTDGKYELTGVPVGRWHVSVLPKFEWERAPKEQGYFCYTTLDMDFVAGARVTRPIHFDMGGRIEFDIDGWDGNAMFDDWVPVTLRSASGVLVPFQCAQRFARQGGLGGMSRSDQLCLVGRSGMGAGLAPGKYTLTIGESFVTAKPVTFESKSDETTLVRVAVARR